LFLPAERFYGTGHLLISSCEQNLHGAFLKLALGTAKHNPWYRYHWRPSVQFSMERESNHMWLVFWMFWLPKRRWH
jgi:hypothetical protein